MHDPRGIMVLSKARSLSDSRLKYLSISVSLLYEWNTGCSQNGDVRTIAAEIGLGVLSWRLVAPNTGRSDLRSEILVVSSKAMAI